MSKGLEALERLMANYYEMCQDSGSNDEQDLLNEVLQ